MSINLEKGHSINLEKSGSGLKKVFVGLGWDAAKPKKSGGGFFSRFLESVETPASIDLDASAILYDANKNLIEMVWFRHLKSSDGQVFHHGDNLTGDGDGDDEVISVNLEKLSDRVNSIVFVVSSFRGQTFKEVENASCRVVDDVSKQEIGKFVLSDAGNHTAYIMAKLSKKNGVWAMQAIGEPADGQTVESFTESAKRYL